MDIFDHIDRLEAVGFTPQQAREIARLVMWRRSQPLTSPAGPADSDADPEVLLSRDQTS